MNRDPGDARAQAPSPTQPATAQPSGPRLRASLVVCLLGLFVFAVGAKPDWFGWDRSPVVGFVQIAVFLAGLGFLCGGGYLGLLGLWKGYPRTIVADLGLRMVGTGYVIAIFAGMADIAGMGSQPLPGVPYFGPWQAIGVLIGEVVIALGFLMVIPYRKLLPSR
ncbi:MAG TPA: hypothetical protein VFH29_07220 [Anaerolineales bacterium]|nr:hypothetical protein [Anaerolineales bacterium]